jgi:hypothetical protein
MFSIHSMNHSWLGDVCVCSVAVMAQIIFLIVITTYKGSHTRCPRHEQVPSLFNRYISSTPTLGMYIIKS